MIETPLAGKIVDSVTTYGADMGRPCPNSEYCAHSPCLTTSPDCRYVPELIAELRGNRNEIIQNGTCAYMSPRPNGLWVQWHLVEKAIAALAALEALKPKEDSPPGVGVTTLNISDLPKPPRAFVVGDAVEIYMGNHQGERTPGKVVAVLNLPGWIHEHYVIECEIGAPDPDLEVRDGYTTHRAAPLPPDGES